MTSMDVVESGAAVRVVSGGGGSSSGVVAAAGLEPVGIDDDDELFREDSALRGTLICRAGSTSG